MRRPPLTYKKALAWLHGLQRFGIKLGLENIQRLIAELSRKGDLQIALGDLETASPWKVFHVAGTNGKGSVCAMIDSILRVQEYRTGLFTSPHLVTFRERIRVSGEMISEDAVANGLTVIRDLVTDWEPHPTFFEVTTALALKHFSDVMIDIAVLETGLGGRFDATNAVRPSVSVITPIDFDHEKWLGRTISEITSEKAGIIKPRVPWDERAVIDGAHNPAATRALAETWREVFGGQRATLILAILSDKNLRGICEALAPISKSVLLPKIRSERAAEPEELAKILSALTPSLPHSITPSVAFALDQARKRPQHILLTGSLHFAGEAIAHLRGEPAAFEECAQ